MYYFCHSSGPEALKRSLDLQSWGEFLCFPGYTMLLRAHSFWDFSGRGISGISIPNSTYSSSSSNGTEIILFQNKSPKFIQIYHHYSSYSCSSSHSTLWGGTDGIDRIFFQLYLFPKNVAFHLIFLYSTSSYSQKLPKGMQSKISPLFPVIQENPHFLLCYLFYTNSKQTGRFWNLQLAIENSCPLPSRLPF